MATSKNSSFRKAFTYLKLSTEYFEDTVREAPGSVAASVSKKYIPRLTWITKDFKSNPHLPQDALQGFAEEMNGDLLFYETIQQKLLDLTPANKIALEHAIDCLLKGEETTIKISA